MKASPVARRLASERGIDLHSIAETGVGGAITRDDVLKAAPPETKRARPKPERVRLAIAAAMARSNREIPHYYLETHIDMKPATDWLAEQNQKQALEERLLPVVILLKAVARSLGDVPS